MNPATELIPETANRKERDGSFASLKYPTFPSNPHIEVKHTGRVGQGNYDLALHWDAMPVNFPIKCLAKGDRV